MKHFPKEYTCYIALSKQQELETVIGSYWSLLLINLVRWKAFQSDPINGTN